MTSSSGPSVFPRVSDFASVDEYIRTVRSLKIPVPPQVKREERRFNTYQEAENKLGVKIPEHIRHLFRQPRVEQRTPEWFLAREMAITASDFAAAIGANPWQSAHKLIEKKTGGSNSFAGNKAIDYGVVNEDRALACYERKTGAITLDFGLISHHRLFREMPEDADKTEWFKKVHEMSDYHDWTWLKGSADGVALHKQADGSYKAVLLEIKCPISNFTPGKITSYYYPQVQLLLWLMDLEEAHFVQYNPPDECFDEKYDLLVIKRNDEWLDKARQAARVVWEVIDLQRRFGTVVPRADIDTIQVGHFPPFVSFPESHRDGIPATTDRQLKNIPFLVENAPPTFDFRSVVGKRSIDGTSVRSSTTKST